MDIAKYSAGTYTQQYQYKSFSPAPINVNWTWSDRKTHLLIEQANLKLGELNAFSLHVPDVDIFIQMHVVKEATTSSRIEGTRTEVEDALLKKKDIDPEKRDDWQEVQNYIRATTYAIKRLKDVPLSTRLLKEAHAILMKGVQGRSKQPGGVPKEPELDWGGNLERCDLHSATPRRSSNAHGRSGKLSAQ